MKLLLCYLIVSLLTDIICWYLAKNGMTNYLIRNVFTLAEFTCLAYIYFKKFDSPGIKTIIKAVTLLFYLTAVFLFVVVDKLNQQEDLLSAISAFFFMLLGYIYGYHLFRDYKISKLQDDSFFWVNNAILIYFSANFVLFLFFGFVVKFKMELFYFVYSFQLLTSIIYYVIISFGIWKAKNY